MASDSILLRLFEFLNDLISYMKKTVFILISEHARGAGAMDELAVATSQSGRLLFHPAMDNLVAEVGVGLTVNTIDEIAEPVGGGFISLLQRLQF